MIKAKLYSPNQVYAGSFLGGPLAMIVLLKRNFDTLGNREGARRTLIGGAVFIALLLLAFTLALLFTETSTGPANYLFPLIYSIIARQIAGKYQMQKQAILDSKDYEIRSNWNVFGISLAYCVLFCVIAFPWGLGVLYLQDHLKPTKEITFIPDSNNAKVIVVRGWTSEELTHILADFDKMYKNDLRGTFAPEVSPTIDGIIHIRFPNDIPGQHFAYLINYIQYPDGFDLKGRFILVMGETFLTPDFQGTDKNLLGKDAILYVPSGDSDHMVIYVQVDNQTFEDSLVGDTWKKVTDQRLPPGMSNLL